MNADVVIWLNGIAVNYSWLGKFVAFFAEGFGYMLLGALLYFLFTHDDKEKGTREIAIMLTVAFSAWALAHVIKYFFYSPRPFIALPGVEQLLLHDDDSAFPSGHAAFYSALAMAMFFYHRRIAVVLGVGALIIGIARIAAGLHYPMDIFAGFALGIFLSSVAYSLIRDKTSSSPPLV